jgi:hypothetical protein
VDNRKIRIIIIPFALLVILVLVYIYKEETKINYTPSGYELKLINYFKDVTLNSEFDDSPHKIIKWNKPMFLYVLKENPCEEQIETIQKTVDDINELATDGFRIELTEDSNKKNSILYLLNKKKAIKLDSSFFEGIKENFSGLTEAEFQWSDYSIIKSKIFINEEEFLQLQKVAILEEVTQSIGLMNDSKTYTESVFYQNKSEEDSVRAYSNIDRDIIKLLYHPKMKSGLNGEQVDRVIMRIFKNKEIELSGS